MIFVIDIHHSNRLYYLGTIAEGSPIVPISAQLKYNIEVICEYICKKIPVPVRDFTSKPRLIGKMIHNNEIFSNFKWSVFFAFFIVLCIRRLNILLSVPEDTIS